MQGGFQWLSVTLPTGLPQSTGMPADGIPQNASGWRDGCVDIPPIRGAGLGGVDQSNYALRTSARMGDVPRFWEVFAERTPFATCAECGYNIKPEWRLNGIRWNCAARNQRRLQIKLVLLFEILVRSLLDVSSEVFPPSFVYQRETKLPFRI